MFHDAYHPAKSNYRKCLNYQIYEMADLDAKIDGTAAIYQAVRQGFLEIVSDLQDFHKCS